jgi:hypothetical protein
VRYCTTVLVRQRRRSVSQIIVFLSELRTSGFFVLRPRVKNVLVPLRNAAERATSWTRSSWWTVLNDREYFEHFENTIFNVLHLCRSGSTRSNGYTRPFRKWPFREKKNAAINRHACTLGRSDDRSDARNDPVDIASAEKKTTVVTHARAPTLLKT